MRYKIGDKLLIKKSTDNYFNDVDEFQVFKVTSTSDSANERERAYVCKTNTPVGERGSDAWHIYEFEVLMEVL